MRDDDGNIVEPRRRMQIRAVNQAATDVDVTEPVRGQLTDSEEALLLKRMSGRVFHGDVGLKFRLDTGADMNCISVAQRDEWRRVRGSQMRETVLRKPAPVSVVFVSATESDMRIVSEVTLDCTVVLSGHLTVLVRDMVFHVIDTGKWKTKAVVDQEVLLGLPGLRQLQRYFGSDFLNLSTVV
jgi:hypothetical protein